MSDGRLHVVAAPGSGKTILGIEVLRRLNSPTLVLAPTLTIRDQWTERLVQHFLPQASGRPDWVSTDLKQPAFLTVTTYQALHALCSGEPERDEPPKEEENGISDAAFQPNGDADRQASAARIPAAFLNAGFRTLVVDEAHHLRSEWWKTLTLVAEHLDSPSIVALTATPPYDVSPFEWQRYEDLCGPVDAEVSVPELVLEGDLCPHQDYVYFSTPNEWEQKELADFRAAVDEFVGRLRSNEEFKSAVARHPWMIAPEMHVEEILDDPQYVSSMVVFLRATGTEVPKEAFRVLAIKEKQLPALDLEWLEILLEHLLYSDDETFRKNEALLKGLRKQLLEIGAIERRHVKLRNPSDHTRLLTTSVTKLKSIAEIVRLESSALGDRLRCVVLTDFIRKAEMPKSAEEHPVFEDIGIVPIFEALRRVKLPGVQLGVLTGSLVIVPNDAEDAIRQAALEMGVREEDLTLRPLANDSGYCEVELRGEYYHGAVRLVTAVFERGGVNVLVGTKSLLGEGWDAPAINTLILASFVGSYMLSNQMRGRSIRVDTAQPEKTANIWHLVCAEPGPLGPGDDYELLVRRCGAFVGVSATTVSIENGTERLGLGKPPYSREEIGKINERTCLRALDRAGLRAKWKEALDAGAIKQMTDGLNVPGQAMPGGFLLANTIAALLLQALFIFTYTASELSRSVRMIHSWKVLLAILGVAAVISLPWALLAVWRFIRHGTPERSMKQIARVLLESLCNADLLQADLNDLRIYTDRNEGGGSVYCWIGGGSGKDQAMFLRALREVVSPVENPRYLLARTKVWRYFREDYFSVPEALARKKEFAEFFAQKWKCTVGTVELVYTRTPEGRQTLLRARMHSLAAAFQKRSERVSCWK